MIAGMVVVHYPTARQNVHTDPTSDCRFGASVAGYHDLFQSAHTVIRAGG